MKDLLPAPLLPFQEVIKNASPENFVTIGEQSVYVQDKGSGPAIVLLHGFASSSYSFREVIEPLSRSFRVLAIDLNGFGMTQRPENREAYRITNQAGLIHQVLQSKGLNKAVIVGHSYGAATAAVLAVMYPELVSRIVMISPPTAFDRKPPWYLRSRLGIGVGYFMTRALLSDPVKFREIAGRAVYVDGVFTDDVSEIYRKSMLVEGLEDAFFGYLAALKGSGETSVFQYQNVAQPVLIIAGEKDTIVSPETCRELAEQIANAQFTLIQECGHCPPEERPEEVLQSLTSFLGQPPFV